MTGGRPAPDRDGGTRLRPRGPAEAQSRGWGGVTAWVRIPQGTACGCGAAGPTGEAAAYPPGRRCLPAQGSPQAVGREHWGRILPDGEAPCWGSAESHRGWGWGAPTCRRAAAPGGGAGLLLACPESGPRGLCAPGRHGGGRECVSCARGGRPGVMERSGSP